MNIFIKLPHNKMVKCNLLDNKTYHETDKQRAAYISEEKTQKMCVLVPTV